MIYQMTKDLAVRLHARSWPVAFYYADSAIPPTKNGSLVVRVYRDRESGDGVTYAEGLQRVPRKLVERRLGVVADVYVSASAAGARVQDHEHICDDLIDALVCEIDMWGVSSRAGHIEFSESRYLTREEMDAIACGKGYGVAYRLRYHVPRGVTVRDYDGPADTVVAPVGISATCEVSLDGTTFEEVED